MPLSRILIFPSGTEAGLEIYRALQYSPHVQVFGANSVEDHASFTYPQLSNDLPFIHEKNCLPELQKICQKHKIDFIFPAHDSVLEALATTNIQLPLAITSCPETNIICRSKRQTYSLFKNIIPTPQEFHLKDLSKNNSFPIFIKPDVGQGSRGTHIAHNLKEAEFYTYNKPELMLLEYLPGTEYTIDCFTDRHGVLRYSGARVRQRVNGGISVQSVAADNDIFKDYAEKINNTLDLRGMWFFQLKLNHNKEFALLEVAPRVAGAMGYARLKGVNLPLLAVYDQLDQDVFINPIKQDIVMDRALSARSKTDLKYEHMYIDLDDTIIIRNQVNIAAISAIYTAKNQGKKVYLLTKHSKNLDQTLQQYNLTEVFDEVIHIAKSDKKSDFIQHDSAIFIDDSHQERQEVARAKNIPVLAVDMLEILE